MFNSKNNLAINFILISLIIFFLILTSLFDLYDSYSEHTLIEVIQVIVLLSLLIINIRNKAIFLKFSNNFFYRLRNIFWGFLIYEEMSFLTRGVFNFTNKINSNTELNFHNLIFYTTIFKNIPF